MRSMTTAERNRKIKKALEAEYGTNKVWVRGSRGTAYGWVHVYIDFDPNANDVEGIRSYACSEERTKVWNILAKADLNKEIGTYGYDDPGSDYGYGSKINIDFRVPYDVLSKREEELKAAV